MENQTKIPKEFLVNDETIEKEFPPGPLAEHLNLVKHFEPIGIEASNDYPPDGCGIGIGSSYRDL